MQQQQLRASKSPRSCMLDTRHRACGLARARHEDHKNPKVKDQVGGRWYCLLEAKDYFSPFLHDLCTIVLKELEKV